MKVFIVYCHPSKDSFTYQALQSFIKGLEEAKHEYTISDLYTMHFNPEISEEEYLREANYKYNDLASKDVIDEQTKIQECDCIVFIYPLFWTDCPAMLKGWFDRVWNAGFAYGDIRRMKKLDKALVIISAGKTLESLEEVKEKEAIETVMLNDRIRNRAIDKELVILDGTTKYNLTQRNNKIIKHLETCFNLGKSL